MAKFFKNFPKTIYSLDNNPTSVDYVTNLTTKFGFAPEFKDNALLYYNYIVTDGETPEMLAHKIYGDSEKHWIILGMNDIFNPVIDWPIEQRSLLNIIESKYLSSANTQIDETGLEWAQQNYHSYYKIETQTNSSTDDKIFTTLQIDANTYANVSTSTTNYTLNDGNVITVKVERTAKTYYDYEIEQNENKRIIKILHPQFMDVVDEEFKRVSE